MKTNQAIIEKTMLKIAKVIKDWVSSGLNGQPYSDNAHKRINLMLKEALEEKDAQHRKEMIELVKSIPMELCDDPCAKGGECPNWKINKFKIDQLNKLKDLS